jgi:hypothetical protein
MQDTAAYNGRMHSTYDYLVIIVSIRLSEAPFELVSIRLEHCIIMIGLRAICVKI